ncbi:SDR family NAD(P)-dependent oxidoreductase [Aromatoleum toluclasticum]|uniref:SDR family NAD(P)-dependent oxidoreductase n=1 Tax=Aromatoleum toluclasticum TaxID=92003 RepID=UPI001D17EB18|nr:SDR family NAD(P)-dependent oxidoreductase [Aromatoleum toluclasticum]MCC4114875.1 SDR family NAD(P)-dependent oxidoreductase [Aromatoleum toluclasticum]
MQDLAGRVAVITGAASGIGAAMAWRFARAGMKIVAADVDETGLAAVCAELVDAGHAAISVRTNVASADEVEALAERAYAAFGAVHLLCNNAGVVPSGRYRAVWEFPLEDWRWSLDVNLYGVIHGLRSFIPRMLDAGHEGHVLTTASVAGLISGSGSAVYSAAKHAAVRVTEALYASLRERNAPISVSLLCPGLVNTRIYESERSRPEALRPADGPARETAELQAIAASLYAGAMSPEEVAELACQAVLDERLYVLTTDSFDDAIRERMTAILERRNPAFATLLALSRRDVGERGRPSTAATSPTTAA